ncbi:MAG: hypothetical protein DRJ35_04100 [Thermoprotei archaeon]|nr:MAG: hypothetical protein DRJ35_04100 [Thermoprotei archaeon]
MLKIYVRGKKDRDAVKAALNTFYKGWSIEVKTFKGKRDEEAALNILQSEEDKVPIIVLLGRQEAKFLNLSNIVGYNVVLYSLRYNKVRNARTIAIAKAIENARAIFRLGVSWRNIYIFDHRLLPQLIAEKHPSMDLFFVYTRSSIAMLEKLIGEKYTLPLLLRKMTGRHLVFDCGKLVAKLVFPDTGLPLVEEKQERKYECKITMGDIINANEYVLDFHVHYSLKILKSVSEPDEIIVPLSGGKDSLTVLLLALRVWDKEKITGIYVDTGVDFRENTEYIDYLSDKLGIRIEKIYAPVRENIALRGLPTHENRWCTELKVKALHKKVREVSKEKNVVVVIGDRDSESRSRSIRPPIRREENWTVVAPLKMWGTHYVQMFLYKSKIKINPLYEIGFYRTGCFICPSLRSWEIFLLKESRIINRILKEQPHIVKDFLKSKNWEN